MLEPLLSGLLGLVAVSLGAFISFFFSRAKYRLEIQRLEIEVSRRDLERDQIQLGVEKLKSEIKALNRQEEHFTLEQEKAKLEVEKLKSEIAAMKDQELKYLTDEFWRKMSINVSESRAEQQIHWPTLKAAFLSISQIPAAQTDPMISLEVSVIEISNRYEDKKLSNPELIQALSEIDCLIHEIESQEHLVFNEIDRAKARDLWHDKLRHLRDRLFAIQSKILRASIKPGMSFSNTSFHSIDLRGMNLSETSFYNSYLHSARLQHANLKGANLEGANLNFAKLESANLQGAILREARLIGADLRDANLEEADLSGTELKETDFRGANLNNAIFIGAKYSKGQKYGRRDTKWPDGFDPDAAGAHTYTYGY